MPISQSEFLSPDEAFVMSHEVVDDRHVKINWKIHPGYYLYMGMFEFESLDIGIEVTASHNPIDYNGMKIVKRGSQPLSNQEFANIKSLAEKKNFNLQKKVIHLYN